MGQARISKSGTLYGMVFKVGLTRVKYCTMSEDELENFLQKQIEVCGEATEFAMASVELLKNAVLRIQELENTVNQLQENQKPEKKKKSKKKKKK